MIKIILDGEVERIKKNHVAFPDIIVFCVRHCGRGVEKTT
jgi:hypothetical protein